MDTVVLHGTIGDMQDTPAPVDPSGTDAGRARRRRRRPALMLLLVLGIAVTANIGLRPCAYYLMSPGPAPQITTATTGTITNPEFGRHGTMLITTVKVEKLTWSGYLRAKVHPKPHTSLIPAGDASPAAIASATTTAAVQMHDAKTAAWAVAAAHVTGGDSTATGAEVLTVTPGSAAEHAGLHRSDVILQVNDRTVPTAADLPDMIFSAPVHSTLTLSRAGHRRRIPVTLTQVSGRQSLGVQLGTVLPTASTPALDVRTGTISGPSAGLMFALNFTDALAPGDLTAGRTLAGTGTLAADGSVGAITGVADKVAGAHTAGADVFFTPIANAGDAVRAAPAGLTVVPVATYHDALTWLCTHGATSTACP